MAEKEIGRHAAKVEDFFSHSDLALIEKEVGAAERGTSGEIRIVLRTEYDKEWAQDLDGQALHDFVRHGLANTKNNTGILILIILGERKLKILADCGIYKKLHPYYWETLAGTMAGYFKSGNYLEGAICAIREISNQLTFHFPREPDDKDELPNKPIIEEGK